MAPAYNPDPRRRCSLKSVIIKREPAISACSYPTKIQNKTRSITISSKDQTPPSSRQDTTEVKVTAAISTTAIR